MMQPREWGGGFSKAQKTPYITLNPHFFILGPKSNLDDVTSVPGTGGVIPSIRGLGDESEGKGNDIQSPPPPHRPSVRAADVTRRLTG